MKALKMLLASTALLASPAYAEMLDVEKDELTFGFIKLTDMALLEHPDYHDYHQEVPDFLK